jgi:hypothetical protein
MPVTAISATDPMTPATDATPYERIGGAAGLRRIVDRFMVADFVRNR